MGNINNIRFVLSNLKYASAPLVDTGLKLPLINSTKLITEYDRTANVNLEQLFDDERQKSTFFRPTSKFVMIFQNSYSGTSDYRPFINSFYLLNGEQASTQECSGETNVIWNGLPQYYEFDLIRSDYNTSGYTIPDSNGDKHLNFIPKSSTSYNWNVYVSYAHKNIKTKTLQAISVVPGLINSTLTWNVSDGIPFRIKDATINGLNIKELWCPMRHGVSVGDYVKFNSPFNYNGIDTFQVYSIGNGAVGSDEYVVNILDPGFLTGSFNQGNNGTFKRLILNDGSNETLSEYYVREHKIISNPEDVILTNAGFELNSFKDNYKFERDIYTPNKINRVSLKEGSQSYTATFNVDFDLNGVLDNQKRPVSELFFTTVWKGYFGWTKKLKQGYEFNLQKNPANNQPTFWWLETNTNSDTNLTTNSYNTPPPNGLDSLGVPYNFIYTNPILSGDVLDGDICEWNNYTLNENVLSTHYHKIRFNESVFKISEQPENPLGYYYQPHFGVKIRTFSDYIEEGDPKEVVDVPNYAYFSVNRNTFIWRDLYPYGYIDANDYGVDFPFLNGKHHPYREIIFRIIPEGSNYKEFNTYNLPTIDGCE